MANEQNDKPAPGGRTIAHGVVAMDAPPDFLEAANGLQQAVIRPMSPAPNGPSGLPTGANPDPRATGR
jgi:hypothetical protein